MPSFDVVSKVNMHELTNAIDQTSREVSNRFDFKGTNSRLEHSDNELTIFAPAEFQIKQISDILQTKMSKRKIDIECLDMGKELAKKITRQIKDSKIKVQSSIQGEQVRVTGKKRDDLQEIISMLQGSQLGVPLQFVNFRD